MINLVYLLVIPVLVLTAYLQDTPKPDHDMLAPSTVNPNKRKRKVTVVKSYMRYR